MSSIGLPPNYRFLVYNGTGQTIAANAIKVYAIRAKFDTNGALSFESSEATLYDNGSTISTGTYSAGSGVSNATDKYLSGDFMFEVTAPASANGDVKLYVQRSTDDGTTLTRFRLTVGATTIDSSVSGQEAAFSYDVDTSVLTLDLSKYLTAQADPNTKTAATLTVYSADWPDGVVWLHSSGTPDKLNIQVLAVA
ncbi:MAG: hypothetical protein H6974_12815 [Gammaproteobacteria bacterium]|nr:hypothetical protein [Gammaproteobacteria bacterium]